MQDVPVICTLHFVLVISHKVDLIDTLADGVDLVDSLVDSLVDRLVDGLEDRVALVEAELALRLEVDLAVPQLVQEHQLVSRITVFI